MSTTRRDIKQFDSEWINQFRRHLDFLMERFTQKELATIMKMDRGNFSKQITGTPSKKFRERFYKAFTHLLGQDDPVISQRYPLREIPDPLAGQPDPAYKSLILYLDHRFTTILEELQLIKQTLETMDRTSRSPTSPK